MLIKIPIYVEIEKVSSPEMLPLVVNSLNTVFTRTLRKENFDTHCNKILTEIVLPESKSFKIVTKDGALEYLRTKK